MKKVVLGVALFSAAGLAQAQGVYIGGGLSSNELDGFSGDNATGYQVFAGYDLDMIKLGAVKSAVEVGYMDSGEFETCVSLPFLGNVCGKDNATGVWANYVASVDINQSVSVLGRGGLDFGDDDGFMYGVGLGFKPAKQLEIRGEYVVRDTINSLQANVVYHIK